MKKSMLILIVTIAVVIALVLSLKYCGQEDYTPVRLPLDIQEASKDFQSESGQSGFRKEAAEKLMPYLQVGMSKAEVERLLGKPDSKRSSEKLSIYTTFYSQVIQINYDDNGKVFHIEGPGIEFLSHYDQVWKFVQVGNTKDAVASRLWKPSKILDDGKVWHYFDSNDPYLYIVYFDDKDIVIKLERPELKKD